MYSLGIFSVISSEISEATVATIPTSFLFQQASSSTHDLSYTHIGHRQGAQPHVWHWISHRRLGAQILSPDRNPLLKWSLHPRVPFPQILPCGTFGKCGDPRRVGLTRGEKRKTSFLLWLISLPVRLRSPRSPISTHNPQSSLSWITPDPEEELGMRQTLYPYLSPTGECSKIFQIECLRTLWFHLIFSTYAYMHEREKTTSFHVPSTRGGGQKYSWVVDHGPSWNTSRLLSCPSPLLLCIVSSSIKT